MKRNVVGWALAAILGAAGAVNAEVILQNFPGINLNNTLALGRGFVPPDMGGAVGDQYIAQFVNGAFAVYSRTGALQGSITSDLQFWQNAGISSMVANAGNCCSDPRTL